MRDVPIYINYSIPNLTVILKKIGYIAFDPKLMYLRRLTFACRSSRIIFFVLALAIPVLYSCDDGAVNKAKVVFTSGYTGAQGKETAVYWKDNEVIRLGDGTKPSSASAIFVANNDVYAGGYEIIIDPVSQVRRYTPAIWKNGVKIKVSSSASPTQTSSVSGIYVSGNDVHAIGNISTDNTYNIGVYWKNGETVESLYNAIFSAILVYKGDVYIAGKLNDRATYWKNGEAVQLSEVQSSAKSISIDHDVVYVLGELRDDYLTPANNVYWRNGEVFRLGTFSGETGCYEILAINDDIYICGSEYLEVNGNNVGTACYWKNGTRVDVGGDRTVFSYATGMSVVDGEVFLSVSEDPIPSDNIPTPWYTRDLIATRLADPNLRGRVYSIFVAK